MPRFTLILICVWLFPQVGRASDLEGLEFFESKIRPVLIKHCYECHSADAKGVKGGLLVDSAAGLRQGGDSGASLVENKPEESLLLEALRFESFEMPPSGKLPDEVLQDFERWIEMGAPDPRTESSTVSPRQGKVDVEQGRAFWAFQPPEGRVVPEVSNSDWPKTWIDNFVLYRLEQADLTPMPTADRATLLRRLSYDLTGLPPSEEGLEELLYSNDSRLIEEYVERLLESPHFGEHWGRHWLDVARYADSNGGDFNATFHDAWRYRNYIIESFNEDRPFNELIVEQIAGDLLPAENDAQRTRQIVATGFLMLGTKMLSERDKEKLRMDVVDEQIDAIGSAFMGMTLGCARCHDHKFDPIPTQDYYALAGILRSTQTLKGESQQYVSTWQRQPLPVEPEHAAALKAHEERSQELGSKIKSAEESLKKLESSASFSSVLNQGTIVDDEDAEVVGQWKGSTYSKNFVGNGYIHDDRQGRGEKQVTFRAMLPEDGEYEVRIAYPGSNGRASNVPVKIIHADGETALKVDQSKIAPIEKLLKPLGTFRFTDETAAVVTISNAGADGYVIADAVQFVSTKELERAASEGADRGPLAEIEKTRRGIESLKEELKKHQSNAPPPAPTALAVQDAEERGDSNVCIRGEPRNLGPKVPRGFLQVARFDEGLHVEGEDSGRLELAEWIADSRHPLTARVYVNRVWNYLLGEGLVRSVDNFGLLGERPTHPELLDELAVEFINHDWSTKWLVRELVLSHVYQLSSEYDEERWQVDPENRLLWRAHRKRLPAEAIRDSMLLSAGTLNLQQGGPTVSHLGTLVTQNRADDQGVQVDSSNLRTLYQPVIRNELPSVMRVFDFADPDFVTGSRPVTTVPAQALWMLNSPFVAEHAERVASAILDRDLSTDGERIEQLYLVIMGRPPVPEEAEPAAEFIRSLVQENGDEQARREAWIDLTHSLFASSAYRMLD